MLMIIARVISAILYPLRWVISQIIDKGKEVPQSTLANGISYVIAIIALVLGLYFAIGGREIQYQVLPALY